MIDLRPFFAPTSVVIIGASRSQFTFNWTLVKNILEARWRGELDIIHPEAEDILGVKCYKSLKDLNSVPELAIVLLTKNLDKVIKKIGEFGIKYICIESDLSPLPEQHEIIKRIKKIAIELDMQIMGPSMIGIINTKNFFTTSIIPVRRHIIQKHRRNNISGGLSFLAQSGGLSGAMGWWTSNQPMPISKVIHTGSSVTVSDAMVLEYLFNDPDTKVISLYLKDPSKDFIENIAKNSKKKPVLYKNVGKNEEIKQQLLLSGAIQVDNYVELFEFAKIFLWCPPPKGSGLGIVGPSSGAIRLLTAEMVNNDLHLAKLTPLTKETILNKVGGSTCIRGNPVDYWPPKKFVGIDVCSIYYNSSQLLLDDDSVDGLFLALEFFSEIEFDFEIFAEIKKKFPDKPIITVLIQAEKEGVERIINCATKLQIPVFVDEVERAIKGFAALLKFYQSKSIKTD